MRGKTSYGVHHHILIGIQVANSLRTIANKALPSGILGTISLVAVLVINDKPRCPAPFWKPGRLWNRNDQKPDQLGKEGHRHPSHLNTKGDSGPLTHLEPLVKFCGQGKERIAYFNISFEKNSYLPRCNYSQRRGHGEWYSKLG